MNRHALKQTVSVLALPAGCGWRPASRRHTELDLHQHRRSRLRGHRAVRVEAQPHAASGSDGAGGPQADVLLRGARLLAVAGVVDDRLLSQAVAEHPSRALSRETTSGWLRKKSPWPNCSSSRATRPAASASGTWAISPSSCPGDRASTTTSACPTRTTWGRPRTA